MANFKILFQGSYKQNYAKRDLEHAKSIAKELGRSIIYNNFHLILTGYYGFDEIIGKSAEKTCNELKINPDIMITTYTYGPSIELSKGFGKVIHFEDPWHESRTRIVEKTDAVIGLMGGRGTSDCLWKALLAKKPLYPIGVAEGESKQIWKKLYQSNYCNVSPGDIDFLADLKADPQKFAKCISENIKAVLSSKYKTHSRKIFIVHGHDTGILKDLCCFLTKLDFEPIVLQDLPEKGRSILNKLIDEVSDVGYGIVLMTEDDFGASKKDDAHSNPRARQNVIFEYGMLIGLLGTKRVCAIMKSDIEIPSDLKGLLCKKIPPNSDLESISTDLIRELQGAGYSVDANKIYQ